jgi:hypothetical protein
MKSKQKAPEIPKLTLAECISELNLINGNLFTLKLGVQQLIEAVESGNMLHAKSVIDVFGLKQVLDNLNSKI